MGLGELGAFTTRGGDEVRQDEDYEMKMEKIRKQSYIWWKSSSLHKLDAAGTAMLSSWAQ